MPRPLLLSRLLWCGPLLCAGQGRMAAGEGPGQTGPVPTEFNKGPWVEVQLDGRVLEGWLRKFDGATLFIELPGPDPFRTTAQTIAAKAVRSLTFLAGEIDQEPGPVESLPKDGTVPPLDTDGNLPRTKGDWLRERFLQQYPKNDPVPAAYFDYLRELLGKRTSFAGPERLLGDPKLRALREKAGLPPLEMVLQVSYKAKEAWRKDQVEELIARAHKEILGAEWKENGGMAFYDLFFALREKQKEQRNGQPRAFRVLGLHEAMNAELQKIPQTAPREDAKQQWNRLRSDPLFSIFLTHFWNRPELRDGGGRGKGASR